MAIPLAALGIGALNLGRAAISSPLGRFLIPKGIRTGQGIVANIGKKAFDILKPVAKDIRTGVTRPSVKKGAKYFDDAGRDITDEIKKIIVAPRIAGKPGPGNVGAVGGTVDLGYKMTGSGYILGGTGLYYGGKGIVDLFKDDSKETESLKSFLNSAETKAEETVAEDIETKIKNYKDDPSIDNKAFEAQYEKYKELFGDGKDEAKTQANYNLMQMGLNLLTQKGDNFLEIFGNAAKEPVKNLQALAYDVAKQDKELKAAAISRVESKEDQAFAADVDLDKIKLQQDFQKQMLKDEQSIGVLSSLYTQGLTAYGDLSNDPRVGMYTRIEGNNVANSALGQKIGLQPMDTDEVIPSNEDLKAFYEVVAKAKNKNKKDDVLEAIDDFKEAFGVTELTAIDFFNLVDSNQDYFGL